MGTTAADSHDSVLGMTTVVARALVVVVLLVLGTACGGGGPAAVPTPTGAAAVAGAGAYLVQPGEQPTAVKAAWCAISACFVQMFVVRDYNLFARYGLDVQTSQFTDSLAALQAGEIDFLFCAAAATIPGLATGLDATIIAAPLVGLPYVMVARQDIHSVQDLKGRKIGIYRQGNLDDRLSHAVLEQEHMPADSVQF